MKKLLILALLAGATMLTPGVQAATAILAGGCFWCMEADFEKLDPSRVEWWADTNHPAEPVADYRGPKHGLERHP